jgi:epoxyqueuosine reductase
MGTRIALKPPFETGRILLHSCCAPCSAAILPALLENGIVPLVFYFNPNIYPQEEYERRKAENKGYAESLGISFIDADYAHEEWKAKTWELRDEPERGARCSLCFRLRLVETARFAHEKGYELFATTLSSSRWKSLEQIDEAGSYASSLFPGLAFWASNWRKGGLAERQIEIIRQRALYRQRYCGCEYSMRAQGSTPAPIAP